MKMGSNPQERYDLTLGKRTFTGYGHLLPEAIKDAVRNLLEDITYGCFGGLENALPIICNAHRDPQSLTDVINRAAERKFLVGVHQSEKCSGWYSPFAVFDKKKIDAVLFHIDNDKYLFDVQFIIKAFDKECWRMSYFAKFVNRKTLNGRLYMTASGDTWYEFEDSMYRMFLENYIIEHNS